MDLARAGVISVIRTRLNRRRGCLRPTLLPHTSCAIAAAWRVQRDGCSSAIHRRIEHTRSLTPTTQHVELPHLAPSSLARSLARPALLAGNCIIGDMQMIASRIRQSDEHVRPALVTICSRKIAGYNYDSTSIRREFDESSTTYERSLRSQ